MTRKNLAVLLSSLFTLSACSAFYKVTGSHPPFEISKIRANEIAIQEIPGNMVFLSIENIEGTWKYIALVQLIDRSFKKVKIDATSGHVDSVLAVPKEEAAQTLNPS